MVQIAYTSDDGVVTHHKRAERVRLYWTWIFGWNGIGIITPAATVVALIQTTYEKWRERKKEQNGNKREKKNNENNNDNDNDNKNKN